MPVFIRYRTDDDEWDKVKVKLNRKAPPPSLSDRQIGGVACGSSSYPEQLVEGLRLDD